MNREIKQLNERLGQALGFAIGSEPRFKWCYAPEVFYYTRTPTSIEFTQRCWAERIGKKWMLCQWSLPIAFDSATGQTFVLTEAQWYEKYQGQLPYPAKGTYAAQPETALPVGMLPDMGDTLGYIHSIRLQMSKDYATHLRECEEEMAADRLENEKQFFAAADSDWPAFWKNGAGHEAGTRGAHVSFGGI